MILNGRGSAVYRLRQGTAPDSYGDLVASWETPSRVRLPGAQVQDVSTEEVDGAARTIVRGEKVLFVPRVADLVDADRIEADGETWRVEGVPTVRRGFALGVYTTATLHRTTGS